MSNPNPHSFGTKKASQRAEWEKLVFETLSILKEQFSSHESVLASFATFRFFKTYSNQAHQPEKIQEKAKGQNSHPKEINPTITPSKITHHPQPQESSKSSKKEDDVIKLEPLVMTTMEPMKELEQIVRKAAPNLTLTSQIPDDAIAKRISTLWKEQSSSADLVILFFQESHQEIHFLKNLAKAVNILLANAKIIDATRLENEKKWDLFLNNESIKLIMVSAHSMQKYPELKRHYKEYPNTSQFFLGKIPLLLLAPFSSYFKTPLLKRSLWQKLCQILKA